MTISGALAGLMAINELMGVQHRLMLNFTGGYGFVGIAVALMGRNHPLGIVLAAVLFGALYQGGSELAFDMPAINRDMVVVIQGLVILFAGALENMLRRRRCASSWRARGSKRRCDGLGLDRPAHLPARQHGPARRRRSCWPPWPASSPSAAASSTSGSRARCWAAPSRRPRRLK